MQKEKTIRNGSFQWQQGTYINIRDYPPLFFALFISVSSIFSLWGDALKAACIVGRSKSSISSAASASTAKDNALLNPSIAREDVTYCENSLQRNDWIIDESGWSTEIILIKSKEKL